MNSQTVIQLAFYRILRALAAVALRYGISAGAVSELVRRAFVDAAESSLLDQGKKPLTSRLCALTGFYRKEIVRIKELPLIGDQVLEDRYNRSARVIAGWLRDTEFTTQKGQPAVLKIDGVSGFNALVKRYSGDMTPKAMLEELIRLQAVEVTERKGIRLTAKAYIPRSSELDTLRILGVDTTELIETIHHNIIADPAERRFQRKVAYVHIPERHVGSFQQYAAKESQLLLQKLDRWLAKRDTENVTLGTPGSKLGVGIYIVETPTPCKNKPDAGE